MLRIATRRRPLIRLSLTMAAYLLPTLALAKTIELDFSEAAPGACPSEPMPSDAFADFGIHVFNMLCGTSAGDALLAPLFGLVPARINFVTETNVVEFEFSTTGPEWQVSIQAFDTANTLVAAFIGSGPRLEGGGDGRIKGSKIAYITIACRETATGATYGCGAVVLSSLGFQARKR